MDPHSMLRWPAFRHVAQSISLASLASLVAIAAFAMALPAPAQTPSEPAVTGDVVSVSGRTVSDNGVVVGTAKAQAFDRSPLEPIAPTVIPPGHYYVQGTGPDSFDSRYRSSGLVRAEQVLGTVVPLF